MRYALRFDGVSQRYTRRGPPALDALSFAVPRGTLCGFVGPNGAGKTTTFSIVAGFLRPTSGTVDVLGLPAFDPWALKGRLGVLPQDAELSDRHSPRELLRHLARLQGLAAAPAALEADRVLDRVNLTDRRDKRIGSLSHGMRRRVAVATALLGDPELVLLDEPTAGLDPLQARSLREELLKRPVGQTIVVSSHNLDELERICDWVVMIDGGRCLRQGTISDVTGRTSTAHWALGPGEVPLAVLQERLPTHQLALKDGVLVHQAPSEADLDPGAVVIASALAAAGVPIREVRRGVSLEARFFEGASKG